MFNRCKLIADDGVNKAFLGRPWRPYAHTLFMNCEIGKHIVPQGWQNWGNKANEQTARYQEYNNTGEGAAINQRAAWSRQLTKKEASQVTLQEVFRMDNNWIPE